MKEAGFDTSLVKVSPRAHIISDEHIAEDRERYHNKLGTTTRGIAPCYRDKYARIGKRAIVLINSMVTYGMKIVG